MNKLAVAMAADSAVTFEQESESKVLNSAMKIFALSKHKPIGMMIYQSTRFARVPWETVIKEYRSWLNKKSYSSVKGFAQSFIRFLPRNSMIASNENQSYYVYTETIALYGRIYRLFERRVRKIIEQSGELTNSQLRSHFRVFVKEYLDGLRTSKLSNGFKTADIEAINKKYVDEIEAAKNELFRKNLLTKTSSSNLSQFFGEAFCRRYSLPTFTGLVIAGFGNDELHPCVAETEIYGIALGKIKRSPFIVRNISHEPDAMIVPYAQRDMVETFMLGIDPLYASSIKVTVGELLNKISSNLDKSMKNLSKKQYGLINKALQDSKDELLKTLDTKMENYQYEHHINPVMDIVGILPVDELADMAEMLVELTSYKRRVSPGSETVGGPVDVAVISRGDGLVWIKRKHYFPAELNQPWFTKYFGGG